MNKKELENFRNWMIDNYGIQEEQNYFGTQTEEIAIRYAQHKQKLNIHSIMQAEGSDSAQGAAVGQRSVGTVAEARDCGCTYSIDCDERKDCVKKQIDAEFARKSSEGQP